MGGEDVIMFSGGGVRREKGVGTRFENLVGGKNGVRTIFFFFLFFFLI